MQNKNPSYNSDNSRPESKKSQSIDRESSSQKSFSSWPSELKRAEISIQNLLHDKESLQSLLSKANNKKEELFKVLIDYKEAVERLKSRNLELEARSNEIDSIKSEISKIRNQLAKRNEKIEFLTIRNQELEFLISELTENNVKASNPLDCLNLHSFESNLKSMLLKIKNFPSFHKLFKTCVPSIDNFIEFIEKNQLGLALNSVCKFANEVMKDYEKIIARDLSPGLSEIQVSSPVSNNATLNSNFYRFDDNIDQERIEKLHLELKQAVARSKELLNNRSVSSPQLIIENSVFTSENRKSIKTDESEIKEAKNLKSKTCKTSKNKKLSSEIKSKHLKT